MRPVLNADNPVLVGLVVRHRRDGDMVAAVFVVGGDHLGKARCGRLVQHVWQQQRKRLIADDIAGAPYGVAEAARFLLARKRRSACLRSFRPEIRERPGFSARFQRFLEFEDQVEVILDDGLVPSCDEYEMFDASSTRLVDNVLDHRPVDNSEHLLRHCLGGWQKAGAEPCDGKDGLADGFHAIL